jgi:probable selenium-dependent hydroxylase accessory protein YqeC
LHYTVGWDIEEGKLTGLPEEVLEEISSWDSVDVMLAEADGSRGKSLKGYRENEPVLTESLRKVIVLVGADVIGKPLLEEHVHRLHLVKALLALREDMNITPSLVADLLLHREGYLERAGERQKMLVINRISNDAECRSALELCQIVQAAGRDVKLFLRGSLFGVEEDTGYFGTREALSS